jgi:hypothetical protein
MQKLQVNSSNVKLRIDPAFRDAQSVVLPDFTMEDVDRAVVDWLKGLNLVVHKDNGQRIDVNVGFTTEERWSAASVEKGFLDYKRNVILPLISVYRSKFDLNIERRVPRMNGTNTIALKIPLKEKNDRFLRPFTPPRRNRWEPLYRIVKVPMPTFADFTYELKIQTDFVSHANQLLAQLVVDNIFFWVASDKGYGFHCSMGPLNTREIGDLTSTERIIVNELTITAYAYLIPQQTINMPTQTSEVSETANLVLRMTEQSIPGN